MLLPDAIENSATDAVKDTAALHVPTGQNSVARSVENAYAPARYIVSVLPIPSENPIERASIKPSLSEP